MASVLANLLSGTQDPSVTSTYGLKGQLFLRIGASGGTFYQKQDDGDTTNWTQGGTGAASSSETVYFKDIKTAGTDGGTFTAGAFQTRDLTTVQNPQAWASLAANQITLNAGTYEIEASAPAAGVGSHQARLYNITDAADVILGTTVLDNGVGTNSGVGQSVIRGTFTLTGTKTLEIQHYGQVTQASNGFGIAFAGGGDGKDELYTQVRITKVVAIASGDQTVLIKDVKATGTDGGTFTSGAWRTRDLNTVENPQTWASLAANQITLDAGTYKISAIAPAYSVRRHQAKLRNITDSTDDAIGGACYAADAVSGFSISEIEKIITIAASKTFEIQHQCGITEASDGFGVAANFGVSEIYTQVSITKIA